MKPIIRNVVYLLLCSLLLPAFSSCIMEDPDDCCYNVSLEYRYQRYGTLGNNELGYYMGTLREYVFNEQDILVAINDYNVPHGGDDFFSEQNLSPGRYTVVAFGNKNGRQSTSSEEIGLATRQDLLMAMDNPQDEGIQGLSDRLYYGYRSFEVAKYGVSRIAVDMTHAHCVLDVTVRWLDDSGHPLEDGNYTLTLRQVPSLYRFMPEFVVYNGLECAKFDPENEDFQLKDRRRINYIPTINRTEQVKHTILGAVVSGEGRNILYGQFITFRYRSDSHVLLSIWSDTQQVMKEIDLERFFRENGIDLDYSLWQEYGLEIEIDGDTVRVSIAGSMSVDDWEDGGEL